MGRVGMKEAEEKGKRWDREKTMGRKWDWDMGKMGKIGWGKEEKGRKSINVNNIQI